MMEISDRGGLVRVAHILGLIENPPNRRTRPLPGDPEGHYDFWFDGGAATLHTGGGTHYEFAGGASAVQPYPREQGYPDVYIRFPDGVNVTVHFE
jgi:hypothetical protein